MPQSASKLNKRNIMLGVCGGVAAFKAVDLASKLTAAGGIVTCVLTENACKLILPKSFEAVTNRPVFTSMWTGAGDFRITHINLAEQSDFIVVAPATANIIAKIAGGICDDLLSTTLCACWKKPVLIAPAMNDNMWSNPAVQRNIEAVKQMGFKQIGPVSGRLACGSEGMGRMAEVSQIKEALEEMAG